jgi:hypothetical protein
MIVSDDPSLSLKLPRAESFIKIRKVKAVSPSPFYDGKYHPPEN